MDAPVSRLGPLAGKKVFGTMGTVGVCVLMWELNTETEGPEEEYDQLPSYEIIPEDSRTD